MKKIFLFPLAFLLCSVDCGWIGPPTVTTLTSIQVMNVDNSGAKPFIPAATAAIPAKAYMIGVQLHGELEYENNNPSSDRHPYGLSDTYTFNIYSVGPFNADYPDGADVTLFFKMENNYLPKDLDMGLALFGNPDPGLHSFKVVYSGDGKTVEATIPVVELK